MHIKLPASAVLIGSRIKNKIIYNFFLSHTMTNTFKKNLLLLPLPIIIFGF